MMMGPAQKRVKNEFCEGKPPLYLARHRSKLIRTFEGPSKLSLEGFEPFYPGLSPPLCRLEILG